MKVSKVFIYISLLIFGMGLFTFLDLKDTEIPYDDTYSAFMIEASYSDIMHITAKDVHPPFYYWGLKTFSLLFGRSTFVLRLFSLLGIFLTLLLGCFPIRRFFGDKVAIFFIVLIILFPVTQYLATDIRMYSWTMFFVLACALSAFDIFVSGKMSSWLLFFCTGICAAYLHNYGLLSVFGIYTCLFIILILKKRKVRYLILCGILFSLAYLPWLFQLISQFSDVAGDYWINPLTINDLFLHIYYFYSPKDIWLPFTDFTKMQMMVWLIIIMCIQLVLTLKAIVASIEEKDRMKNLIILSFLTFLFPVFMGGLISFIYVPILVTRYMTCSFGLFVLSLAFVLAKVNKYSIYKKLSYIFLALMFITGGVRVYSGVKHYNQVEVAYNQIREFSRTDNRQIFVVNDFSYHVIPRLQLIMPDGEYCVLDQGKYNNFEPFVFDKTDSVKFSRYILVHQERGAIQEEFRTYQTELLKHNLIRDSLHVLDIYLYKVESK
ncbi:MAG: glycosyltransferase family 39 protein [Prevotella sp.]|nr:glycosyltransferase family 39 protein [Prevotella sp.]